MQHIDRRVMLRGLGAAALATMFGGAVQAASGRTFFQRTGLPIGIQIYMLGPEAGKDLDATFAQVAKIGYREIELPGLFGRTPQDVAAAAARAGLSISSLHLPLLASGGGKALSLASPPAQIVDALGALRARWAVAPLLLLPSGFRPQPKESMENAISRSVVAAGEDIWKRTAALLNQTASALKPLGVNVAYHNHNLEFAPIGKTTGWDILSHETERDLVFFEVDLGWVATGGVDPVRFLERNRGRVRLLHVKDVARDNPKNYGITMKSTEVGSGVMPWKRILPTALRAGVQHFIVEQEPPFAIPRIEAAARSYAFLSQLKA